MKNSRISILTLIFSLLIAVIFLLPATVNARTISFVTSGPNRFKMISVDYTRTQWWMATWSKDEFVCAFYTDHDGLPNENDITSACDKKTVSNWQAHKAACTEPNPTDCDGYYFVKVSEQIEQKDVVVKLDPPNVLVRLDNCDEDEEGWCTSQPLLILQAREPLPNEKITGVHGFVEKDRFDCKTDTCTFKLSQTSPDGVKVSFWADSSYGDSSPVFEALVKVTKDPDITRLVDRWQVDVLSTQWDGPEIASCAAVWQTFRPSEGVPAWLKTPKNAKGLESDIPYDYLATRLIKAGGVDVSSCDNNGFNSDGSLNGCGSEASRDAVFDWQNRFDQIILSVAKDKQVPAQLLKNLFSRESQFWPGIMQNGPDKGLGQITEDGADTALLWNPAFYNAYCPLVLDANICKASGYANLQKYQQNLLQGALVASVDARCDTCPLGIDLDKAEKSIGIFAHTILANCEQAGKLVENITGDPPAANLDYESMWKLTLVNYNAGSGCLGDAITNAYDPSANPALTWDRIRSNLDVFCPLAGSYVDDVTNNP